MLELRTGGAIAFLRSVYQTRYINKWALPRLGLDSTIAGLLLKPKQSIWILCSGVIKSELTAIVYPSSRKKLASISSGLCNWQVAFTTSTRAAYLKAFKSGEYRWWLPEISRFSRQYSEENFSMKGQQKTRFWLTFSSTSTGLKGQIMVSQDMCSLARWSDILNL